MNQSVLIKRSINDEVPESLEKKNIIKKENGLYVVKSSYFNISFQIVKEGDSDIEKYLELLKKKN